MYSYAILRHGIARDFCFQIASKAKMSARQTLALFTPIVSPIT